MLQTAPGSSGYTLHRDPGADPPALVCQVGSTTLRYQLSAVEDRHAWLARAGRLGRPGGADEKKEAGPGTVEAWGRSAPDPRDLTREQVTGPLTW